MAVVQNFYDNLHNAVTGNVTTVVISLIVLMLVYLTWTFFGYKAMKIFSAIFGFGVGIIVGFSIVSIFKLQSHWITLVPAVCALAFAAGGYFIFKAGLFIAETILVAGAVIPYIHQLPGITIDDFWINIIGVVIGLVAGVLSIVFLKMAVIVSSALSGGFGFSAVLFSNVIRIRWSSQMGLIVMAGVAFVLSIAGIIYQFHNAERS